MRRHHHMDKREATDIEARVSNVQERLVAEYAEKYNLSEESQEYLRECFSPHPVPTGMTDGQVRYFLTLQMFTLGEHKKKWENTGIRKMTPAIFRKIVRRTSKREAEDQVAA